MIWESGPKWVGNSEPNSFCDLGLVMLMWPSWVFLINIFTCGFREIFKWVLLKCKELRWLLLSTPRRLELAASTKSVYTFSLVAKACVTTGQGEPAGLC